MKRYRVAAVICLGVALVLAISEVAILIVPGWYFDLPTVMRDMILIPFFGLAGAALWVFGTPFEERKRAFCQLLMPVVILYVIALFVALFGTSGFYREAGGTRSYNLTPFRTIRFYVEAYDNFAVRRRVVAANLCGNLVLFAPVGIVVPYFFKRFRNPLLFVPALLCLLWAVEYTQYLTGRGSLDIDDVILNAAGAIAAYAFVWNPKMQKLWRAIGILEGETKQTNAGKTAANSPDTRDSHFPEEDSKG